MEDMFRAEKNASIIVDKIYFTFNDVNWLHKGKGEFSALFILNVNIINALYSGSELEFDANFGSVSADFDPSITFSLNGFRSVLLVLQKQRG